MSFCGSVKFVRLPRLRSSELGSLGGFLLVDAGTYVHLWICDEGHA